jgi:hypothetical protein
MGKGKRLRAARRKRQNDQSLRIATEHYRRAMERQAESRRLDPEAEYKAEVSNGYGEINDVDVLIEQDIPVTAGYTVGGARYLADGAAGLADTLAQQPYSLRTTADAGIVIEALRRQLDATAGIAAGVATWLSTAHQRGESADPAATIDRLADVAERIRDLARRLDDIEVPEDNSPAMDVDTLAQQVTDHLRQRGVTVDEPLIDEDQITWELPGDLLLSVDDSIAVWSLMEPSGKPNSYIGVPRVGLPTAIYAHPAQVADAVAAYLKTRQQTPAPTVDHGQ